MIDVNPVLILVDLSHLHGRGRTAFAPTFHPCPCLVLDVVSHSILSIPPVLSIRAFYPTFAVSCVMPSTRQVSTKCHVTTPYQSIPFTFTHCSLCYHPFSCIPLYRCPNRTCPPEKRCLLLSIHIHVLSSLSRPELVRDTYSTRYMIRAIVALQYQRFRNDIRKARPSLEVSECVRDDGVRVQCAEEEKVQRSSSSSNKHIE